MGRPELMGPEVGAAGGRNLTNQPTSAMMNEWVRESQVPSVRRDAPTYQDRFDATTLANQQRRNALWGSGPSTVSAARPWANLQAQIGDPRQGAHGQADRTTTIKKFADPNKSDEETTVIKDKVQGGPAYNRPPPNWLERVAHGEGPINPGYFGRPTTFSSPPQPEGALTSSAQPTSIMNMNQPGFLEKLGSGIGEQWGNLWDASVLRKGPGAWDAIKAQLDEARRKRYEEAMRARRGY
jgi:hypothetical protein